MKTKYIFLILVAFVTTVFASLVMPPYDNSKTPTLSLPNAYQLAIAAIGSATNQFHCVDAKITTDFGNPRWSFDFYSTNTPPKWKCMTVDFSGKTQEDNGLR
jgi:hypothetical protein